MSNEVKNEKNTTVVKAKKQRKARAVTFTTKTVKNQREFTPVNKRAKALATVVGEKTLTVKNLKGIKKAGFRVLEYKGDKLVAISL